MPRMDTRAHRRVCMRAMARKRTKKRTNYHLRLRSSSLADAEKLAAITALGMITAIRSSCVTADHAIGALFRPSLVQILRYHGADRQLCEALERATELDGIADVVPDALGPATAEILRALTDFLQRTNWPDSSEIGSWTADHP